jgi:hypothetical protein
VGGAVSTHEDPDSAAMHEELEADMLVVKLTSRDVHHLISLLGFTSEDERLADVLITAMREQKGCRVG